MGVITVSFFPSTGLSACVCVCAHVSMRDWTLRARQKRSGQGSKFGACCAGHNTRTIHKSGDASGVRAAVRRYPAGGTVHLTTERGGNDNNCGAMAAQQHGSVPALLYSTAADLSNENQAQSCVHTMSRPKPNKDTHRRSYRHEVPTPLRFGK